MSTKKKILIGLAMTIVIMQFFRINKEVPDTKTIGKGNDLFSIVNAPAEIQTIIKNACYDCHSYETKYPWYAEVAPVSWVVGHHIEEGREHLNFSVWGNYTEGRQLHKMEECAEELEEGEMPLSGYVMMHEAADLSKEEKELLIEWFESNLGE